MIDVIKNELKIAMFAKDKIRVNTLRSILSKLKMKEIEMKISLTDDEALKVLQEMAKQIKDSIEQFINGGRQDLVDKEKTELKILTEFLPAPINEEQIIKIVEKIIKDTGAKDLSDMSKVMTAVIRETNGRADGKIASKIVREKLN